MENLIFTALLYLVVFGVLCNFAKTKPGKPQVNPSPITPQAEVNPVSPQAEAKHQTTSPLEVESLPDELPITSPAPVINSKNLEAIFEDREPQPQPLPVITIKSKRKKKPSLTAFIREVEALA